MSDTDVLVDPSLLEHLDFELVCETTEGCSNQADWDCDCPHCGLRAFACDPCKNRIDHLYMITCHNGKNIKPTELKWTHL